MAISLTKQTFLFLGFLKNHILEDVLPYLLMNVDDFLLDLTAYVTHKHDIFGFASRSGISLSLTLPLPPLLPPSLSVSLRFGERCPISPLSPLHRPVSFWCKATAADAHAHFVLISAAAAKARERALGAGGKTFPRPVVY